MGSAGRSEGTFSGETEVQRCILEGSCVGIREDTERDIGDTGKKGMGMSGILRAISRGVERHLGRDIYVGHKETRWKNIRGQGKMLWKVLRGQEGTLEKTRDGTKEKRGSTGHKSAQQLQVL